MRIAVDRKDPDLLEIIQKDILDSLQISPNRLTRFFNGGTEPTTAEIIGIASVLSKYRPTRAADLMQQDTGSSHKSLVK